MRHDSRLSAFVGGLLGLALGCADSDPEPFSPCDKLGEACGQGGLCTRDEAGSVCNPPCKVPSDCPTAADAQCVGGYCFLYCKSSSVCPEGMECSIIAPETTGLCEWPSND